LTKYYFVIVSNYDNEHVFIKKIAVSQSVNISNIHHDDHGIPKLERR